jgi:hypothetical protein
MEIIRIQLLIHAVNHLLNCSITTKQKKYIEVLMSWNEVVAKQREMFVLAQQANSHHTPSFLRYPFASKLNMDKRTGERNVYHTAL